MKKGLLLLLMLIFIMSGCGVNTEKQLDKYSDEVLSIVQTSLKDNVKDYKDFNSNAVPLSIFYDKDKLAQNLKANEEGLKKLEELKTPNNSEANEIKSKATTCLKKAQDSIKFRLELANNKSDDQMTKCIKSIDDVYVLYNDLIASLK